MAGVLPNEVIDCANPKIDITIKKFGVPIDPALLEYQIFDFSAGPPGAQVFPITLGTRAVANLADCPTGERLSVGHFTAKWAVPAAEPAGSHRITWYFREVLLGTEFIDTEEFEVLAVAPPAPGPFYITVQDIRDLGVPDPPSNADILAAIGDCQAILERATRNWFESRALDFFFDGTDSDAIHFGVPIIDITFLRLNDDTANLDTTLFKVYNGRQYPDDRRNPRIKLIRSQEIRDIFTAPLTFGELKFRKGRQNQRVSGNFGFVEEDGSTPLPIIRALTKMVVQKLTNPIFVPAGGTILPAPPSSGSGSIVEEWTDGHKLKFSVPSIGSRKAGLSGLISDPEVQDIIKLYRAPIGIATPAHWSFQ